MVSWYKLLLCLMEEDPESSHSEIAQHTTALGIILSEKKDFIEAQKTVSKALKIYESIYGKYHYSICSTYATLANIAQKRNSFDEAIAYYREILEIKSRLLGTKHPRVGRDLNSFAMLLASQNQFSEAIISHMGAINAFKHSYGENHTETLNARGNMGITMLLKGDMEGLTIMQETICLLVKAGFSPQHPWLKKFLEYARRGQVGTSKSDDVDVEMATFQPVVFTQEARGLSSKGCGEKSGRDGVTDNNFFESSGLGRMSGMGLHRLNATPLSISDVEICQRLIIGERQSSSGKTHVAVDGDRVSEENFHVGSGSSCGGSTSPVTGDIACDDTERLPFAALVLTE